MPRGDLAVPARRIDLDVESRERLEQRELGALRNIARDREEFIVSIDKGNNANEWLMIPLVDQRVADE